MLKRFLLDESGATAIEYGLIAGLFGTLMVGAFTALGEEYEVMYAYIESVLVDNSPSANP